MNCPICNRILREFRNEENFLLIEYECYDSDKRIDGSINYEYIVSVINEKIVDYSITFKIENNKKYTLETDCYRNEGYDQTRLYDKDGHPLLKIDQNMEIDHNNAIESATIVINRLLKLFYVK